MRENGLVVQQVALSVKTYHLATGAESGIDRQHAFLSERSGEQQLPQVLGEHLYRLLVGAGLGLGQRFPLHRRFQQPFVPVPNGRFDQRPDRGGIPFDKNTLQLLHRSRFIRQHRQFDKSFPLSTNHRQQTVGRHPAQRFRPVEIVRIFGSFLFFAFDHARRDHPLAGKQAAHGTAGRFAFADPFGDNIAGTIQSLLQIVNLPAHETFREPVGSCTVLAHQHRGQRFEPLFPCYRGTGPAFGTIGKVKVFQGGALVTLFDLHAQFGRQFALFVDRSENRLLSLFQFGEPFELHFHCTYLHFVESAGPFLAVAADKRNRRPFRQQLHRMFGLPHRNAAPGGDHLDQRCIYRGHLSLFLRAKITRLPQVFRTFGQTAAGSIPMTGKIACSWPEKSTGSHLGHNKAISSARQAAYKTKTGTAISHPQLCS